MINNKKVLVIGWDAADWNVINPLMDAGQMPALQKLVENGVVGNIATLYPPLSPMLWTSIATGKHADKHGILGFTEPDANNGGIRPVYGSSRKTRAIWNILHNQGLKSNVVGWWPSHPSEPINGVMVSNFFKMVGKANNRERPLTPGSVYPAELEEILHEFQVHPLEFTSAMIKPFVPDVEKLDPKEHHVPIEGIAKILAEASTVQAVSTWLMRNTEWDFMAVYFDAIDHFCHGFMKYHPPRLPQVSEEYFNIYNNVVSGAYILHDMMLERLLELAGEDTTVIILSDHGFYSNQFRSVALPKFNSAPAIEHSPYGVVCISGPGIKKDERVYGASLLDITPTILSIYGLPIGKDMDGKVLQSIFEEPVVNASINSWDQVEGDFGTIPEDAKEDPFAAAEALRQLVDLGYIEDPGEDKNKAMENCANDNSFNLALVYMFKGNYSAALPLLEEVYQSVPDSPLYSMALTETYLALKKFDETEKLLNKISQDEESGSPKLDILWGMLLGYKGEYSESLKHLNSALEKGGSFPGIYLELGRLHQKMERYDEAVEAFNRALDLDGENAQAYLGKGTCLLKKGRFEEAVDNLLSSAGLLYHFAPTHFFLGEALFKMKLYKESSEAFEVCLIMAPRQRMAHQWLVKIYSEYYLNKEKAEIHTKYLDNNMSGTITIVSGLPRSGTSLMMQMLHSGGAEVLTDEIRQADDSNPRGYWEYEPVKALARDSAWMHKADGKALKVIAQLLKFLPPEFYYKIIFMKRDIKEVLISQQKMLNKPTDIFPVALSKSFEKEIERVEAWAESQPNVDILFVNYPELIEDPKMQIIRVKDFLTQDLDSEKMMKVIDPELYRNRI